MPAKSDKAGDSHLGTPHRSLSVIDGVAVLVGVVVGIGVFGFPPLVAAQAPNAFFYMALWVAGGLIALIGALCYAELGSSYPHAGGEYHFLQKAWGTDMGLLFAWARGTVIQTGSIAAAAFIYGEYAQELLPLGAQGVAFHAASVVVLLTLLNMIGTRHSKGAQLVFTCLTLLAVLAVIAGGLMSNAGEGAAAVSAPAGMEVEGSLAGALGMGLVFVLLTYGGWNEAAYLSGELRNPSRSISRVLLLGVALVTLFYLLINLAYLQIFGLEGLRESEAVAADLMRIVAGPWAADFLSLMVCLAALSTINATILTGARVYYALGQDIPQLQALGAWDEDGDSPKRALVVQAFITLGLILFGAMTESGIGTMVAYTAPVFWLFMLATALAVMLLRRRYPSQPRPFQVPLYPVTPWLFAATCAGLLWSSVAHAGPGAIVGLVVLVLGLPLLVLRRRSITMEAGTG